MKHIFENKQFGQIVVDFTKSYKGDRNTIVKAIEEIELADNMQAISVKTYIENDDHNDKERYYDQETSYCFASDSSSFKNYVQSKLKEIFNKIFDNTDNLDLYTITCIFNSVAYKGRLATSKDHKNGRIRATLSILEPKDRYFHIIRSYNIEITFAETIIL